MNRVPATLEEVLSVLRERRVEVREQAGVELVGVVGSLARGEARPDSDVDIIVRHTDSATLFGMFRMEQKLGEEFGRPVEMVFSENMKPERRAWIERDLRPL